MPAFRAFALCSLAALLGACNSTVGPIVRDGVVKITPTVAYSLEKIAVAGAGAAAIYLVYDPLAPNWSIEESVFDGGVHRLSLRAKSFRTGGDGEAMRVLQRRALHLQREGGYSAYRIVDYSEGIESSTPFTHRYAEGAILLVRAGAPSAAGASVVTSPVVPPPAVQLPAAPAQLVVPPAAAI